MEIKKLQHKILDLEDKLHEGKIGNFIFYLIENKQKNIIKDKLQFTKEQYAKDKESLRTRLKNEVRYEFTRKIE